MRILQLSSNLDVFCFFFLPQCNSKNLYYTVEYKWWKQTFLACFQSQRKGFNISPLSTMWTVGCFVMPFTELRRLSSWFAERFHHDGVLNFAKCFFCIYHEFFSFILLSGVFHWLGFQVFNQPYICGINPTSLW